jgi:2-polyprenyl-6-methoxyphenol hydroxylase-like FAD-dependent oxidoreductase
VRSCYLGKSGWNAEIVSPGGTRLFQASTLIDAAGRRPWLGRPSRRRAFDRQVALLGMFEIEDGTGAADSRTWVEAVCSGWWFSASLLDNCLVAAYFTDADLLHAPERNRSALWETLLRGTRLMRDRLRGARPRCDFRVVAASSTLADPIATERYVAIGDAACTIDPLSSQGVLYALTSGLEASEALIGPSRTQAVQRYARAIEARFHDDLRTRQQFCKSERRWPDSPFWRRRCVTRGRRETRRLPSKVDRYEAQSST